MVEDGTLAGGSSWELIAAKSHKAGDVAVLQRVAEKLLEFMSHQRSKQCRVVAASEQHPS